MSLAHPPFVSTAMDHEPDGTRNVSGSRRYFPSLIHSPQAHRPPRLLSSSLDVPLASFPLLLPNSISPPDLRTSTRQIFLTQRVSRFSHESQLKGPFDVVSLAREREGERLPLCDCGKELSGRLLGWFRAKFSGYERTVE